LPEFVGKAEIGEERARLFQRARLPVGITGIEIPRTTQSPGLLEIEHTAARKPPMIQPPIDMLFRPEE